MGKLSATICVPFGAETVENNPCTVGTTRNYTAGTGNRQNTSAQAKERNRQAFQRRMAQIDRFGALIATSPTSCIPFDLRTLRPPSPALYCISRTKLELYSQLRVIRKQENGQPPRFLGRFLKSLNLTPQIHVVPSSAGGNPAGVEMKSKAARDEKQSSAN